MKWLIEYENDTGSNDDGSWEWYNVTDLERSFRVDNIDDAQWLCDTLNKKEKDWKWAKKSKIKSW